MFIKGILVELKLAFFAVFTSLTRANSEKMIEGWGERTNIRHIYTHWEAFGSKNR